MDGLISMAAAIKAALDGADDWDGGYSPERERCIREHMAKVPSVNAMPVEWLEAQVKPYTGDVSDIGKSVRNGTIKDLVRKWQKEQEAHGT